MSGSTIAADSTGLELKIVETDSKGNVIGAVAAGTTVVWSSDTPAEGTISALTDETHAMTAPVGPVGVYNVHADVTPPGAATALVAPPYLMTVVPGAAAGVAIVPA